MGLNIQTPAYGLDLVRVFEVLVEIIDDNVGRGWNIADCFGVRLFSRVLGLCWVIPIGCLPELGQVVTISKSPRALECIAPTFWQQLVNCVIEYSG